MTLDSNINCLEFNSSTSNLTIKGSCEIIMNLRDIVEHISEGNLDEPFLFCMGDSGAVEFCNLMDKIGLNVSIANIRDYGGAGKTRLILRFGAIKALVRKARLFKSIKGLLEDTENEKEIEHRLWNGLKLEIKASLHGGNDWVIPVDDSISDLPIEALQSVGIHAVALLNRFERTAKLGNVIQNREFYKKYYLYHKNELDELFDMDLEGWMNRSLEINSKNFSLLARNANGESLSDIGKELKVSRERIRQITVKVKRAMYPLFRAYISKYCTDGVISLFDTKPKWFDECKLIVFDNGLFPEFDIAVIDEEKSSKIRAILNLLDSSNIIYDYKAVDILEDLHKVTPLAKLDKEYIINHNRAVMGKGYKLEIFADHLKEFYPDGLRLQDKEINEYKESFKEHSGVEIEQDISYFKSLFNRKNTGYWLMGGDNKSYHLDTVVLAPEMIDELHKYLEERKEVYLLYSTVYRAFKDKMQCSFGYFRASLAKYFSNKCIFKSRHFYYITKKMPVDIIDYMVDLSIKENRPITIEDISLYRDEDDINYLNARALNTDKLITLDNGLWIARDILEIKRNELIGDICGYAINGEVDCKVLYENLDMRKYISNVVNVTFNSVYSLKHLLVSAFSGLLKNKSAGGYVLVICNPL